MTKHFYIQHVRLAVGDGCDSPVKVETTSYSQTSSTYQISIPEQTCSPSNWLELMRAFFAKLYSGGYNRLVDEAIYLPYNAIRGLT